MDQGSAKEFVKVLREVSQNYREFEKASARVTNTAKPLKRLIGKPHGETNANGSRLIAAGISLIAFPDPTISDLVGAALVAAGLMKRRMHPPTVVDVYKEIRKVSLNLSNMRKELTFKTKI